MDCRGVSRRLSSYIDDALSPIIKQSLEEHLGHCLKCQRQYEDYKAIIGAARSLPAYKVSEGFEKKIMQAAIAGTGLKKLNDGWRFRLVLAGAAFSITAAMVLFLVGIPSNESVNSYTQQELQNNQVGPMPDFYSNPGLKVEGFPVPEEALQRDFAARDSQSNIDSTFRIDEYVLPELEKVVENVNVRY